MTHIFELIVYAYEGEPHDTYPVALVKERLGVFSTLEQVEDFVQGKVYTSERAWFTPDEVVCFTLVELSLDSALAYYCERVYLPKGAHYGTRNFFPDAPPPAFAGRAAETFRFKVGEVVAFIDDYPKSRLQVGVVAAMPFTPEEVTERQAQNPKFYLDEGDDVYLVNYFNGDEPEHKHLVECELHLPSQPVADELQQRLLELLSEEPDNGSSVSE